MARLGDAFDPRYESDQPQRAKPRAQVSSKAKSNVKGRERRELRARRGDGEEALRIMADEIVSGRVCM